MAPPDLIFVAAVLFLLGILSASLELNFFISLGTVLALLLLLNALYKRKIKTNILLVAFLFLFAFGFAYYRFFTNFGEAREVITYSKNISFSGVIREEPRPTEKAQELILSLNPPLYGKVAIIAPPFPEFEYGDELHLEGTILKRGRTQERARSLFPKIELLERHRGFWIKEKLLDLKRAIVARFRNALPKDQAALLSGITLGARSDFSQELYQDMKLSGTTHIVALSGYNIAILVWVVHNAIGSLLRRRITFWITTALIALFVLMVGGEASVTRAAIMGFLLLFSQEVGRPYHFRNVVALTAAAMALFDPAIVRFDLGFALSFASLLGITYLRPAIDETLRLKKEKGILNWRENMITTISAQLAVLPILSAAVGSFSLSGFLANTAILPFIPLTMGLGFLFGGLALIALPLGFLLAPLLIILLQYQIAAIRLFARIPFSIEHLPGSILFILAYYGIIFLLIRGRGKNRSFG